MLKKQRGLTAISWMLIIGFLGMLSVAVIRITPVYIEYYSVKSILNKMVDDSTVRNKTPRQLKEIVNKRLSASYIDRVSADDVEITEGSSHHYKLDLKYEARGPIFGNLDYVASFEHHVEIPR